MRATRIKEHIMCNMKWRKSCTTMNRHCAVCGKDGIGMTTKADGSIWSCAPGRDEKKCRIFVELPPEDCQPGDEHMCGLLRYAAQNWEEEQASTLSDLQLTRGSACPCVWKGHIKGEDIVATVHGDDVTFGGERWAVEFLIKMISRKYEVKKQVIGGRSREEWKNFKAVKSKSN